MHHVNPLSNYKTTHSKTWRTFYELYCSKTVLLVLLCSLPLICADNNRAKHTIICSVHWNGIWSLEFHFYHISLCWFAACLDIFRIKKRKSNSVLKCMVWHAMLIYNLKYSVANCCYVIDYIYTCVSHMLLSKSLTRDMWQHIQIAHKRSTGLMFMI